MLKSIGDSYQSLSGLHELRIDRQFQGSHSWALVTPHGLRDTVTNKAASRFPVENSYRDYYLIVIHVRTRTPLTPGPYFGGREKKVKHSVGSIPFLHN